MTKVERKLKKKVIKKRRRKLKKKAVFTAALLLLIIIGFCILLNTRKVKAIYYSAITGYKQQTIHTFLEEEIYKDISKHKYSKTLDEIIQTEYYQKEFLQEYLNINYIDTKSFLQEISTFLNKGYNNKNINKIYEILTNDSIEILLEEEYVKNIDNLITVTFFKEDKLKRYITYSQKEANKDVETIVTYVNIGLDNDYYTNIQRVDNQSDLLVLVNKYNQLTESYTPENLQKVSYGSGKLRKDAAEAFDQMCAAAKKDNIKIYGGSGYRSYSYQKNLYNNYVARDGKKLADTYSARAGHSEHQTGLAMDILNKNWSFIDETNKEYEWLLNNSYKYGFILRYLKGKEEITGYKFEPWHYRYVGIDVATEIHNLNITYDEYVAKK